MRTPANKQDRLGALAERSSYIENVLRHALVAGLSSVVWSRDPRASLQVFNSEVDDSGFDLVLSLGVRVRYVQLKQAHADKTPAHCSVRLSFAAMAGSCVVLMAHDIDTLQLRHFRFFGAGTGQSMPSLDSMRASKMPGRRNAAGERKVRAHYRDLPVRQFLGPLSIDQLVDALFPDDDARFSVPPDLEAELAVSVAEAERGETFPADEVLTRLRRQT